MRIAAISAYMPRPSGAATLQPSERVTMTPPVPIPAGPVGVLALAGRGIIVDVVC